MENHATTFRGTVRTIVRTSTGAISSDQTNPAVRGSDVVSGYTLVQGDKKKPTSFFYEATRSFNYNGSEIVYVPSGGGHYPQTETIGVLSGNHVYARCSSRLPDMRNFHYNRALSQLNEKTRGQLDLSVSLAEGSQTARMFASCGRLESYVKLSRNSSLWREIAKGVGGAWLKWQYGLRPLVQDVYGSVDELYRSTLPKLLTVQAKSSQRLPAALALDSIFSPSRPTSASSSGVQGCMFHIRFKEKGGFDLPRWGSLNPASLAWETLPYSFVVDWVYDVGGMLRSLETSLLYGSSFVDGYVTELRAIDLYHSALPETRATSGAYQRRDAVSSYSYRRFRRTALGSYPAPRLPTFRVNLGTERLFSAASLLSQFLGRGR
jgi:hypothetical protein